MNINELSKTVHTWAKDVGWWDDKDRCPYQTIQLFSTEVAEATEGERKNLMDDHLPNRPMGEVELADVVIRAVDMAGYYGWSYVPTYRKQLLHYGDKTIGALHLAINKYIIMLADSFGYKDRVIDACDHNYSLIIDTCFHVAELRGYDLEGAILDKVEYNRTRADHKRENRAQAGGKEF